MAGQKNEPEAKMKNKNIRSRQTKERGQGKGFGSMIGNNIFLTKHSLAVVHWWHLVKPS